MRRGRKRILALGLALAFLFGTMWGTGITPMHGLVAEVGGDAEPEDGEDYDAADTTEEEEPGEPDEETEAEDSLSGSLETDGDDTNPEAGVTGDGGAEDDPVETNAMTVGQEIEADGSADESEETAEQGAEGTEDALEIVADTAGSVDTEVNADAGEGAVEAVPEETAEESQPKAPADTAGETAEVQAAMPEGSLSGTTAGGIHVSASYGENVFPEGTTMQVADLSKEDAIAKAADALDGEVVDAAGADITFYDKQGNEVEPYEGGKVDVTLTLDTPLAEGELTVVHIDDAGKAEELAASDVDEVTETGASFAAAEFSEYVVATRYEDDWSYNFSIWADKNFDYTYDGTEKKPVAYIVAYNWNDSSHTSSYKIQYENNVNAGQATATVTVYFYRSTYGDLVTTKTQTWNFDITKADLTTATVEVADCTYNGAAQTPAVVVKNAKGKVIPADNYDVAYANNTNAGTGTVTVTAKGSNFITSSKDGSFTINPASLANASVSLNDYIHTHTGSAIEPPPIVKYNGTLLEKDTDYTVAYSDNINVGLATITVTGKGNYTGTLTQNFFIKQNDAIDENIDLSKATVTLSADSYTYDGTEKTPEVTVKSKNGVLLTEGTHYRTVYFNNTDAGTAGVVIVPAANSEYKVGNTKNFTINKLDLSEGAVRMSLDQTLYKRDYANKEPVVTVTYQGKPIDSTNYTVTYTDNVYGPDAKATVTGAVNCTGTRELPFTIYAENDISYGDVSVSPGAYTYDGTEKKPKVTVKLDGQTLQENHDYTVEYSNNVKVGTATATVKGTNNYIGTKTATFTIKSSGGSGGSSSSGGSSGSSSASGSGSSSSSSSSSGSSSLAKTYKAGSKGTKADYIKLTKKSVRYDMCQTSSKIKKAKVPDVVKIGKKTYKVTAVSTYAFLDCDKLTSITIGANVKKIGASAFSGCKGVKTLVIQSRLLTKAGVKNCLKGSSVETIIVPDGTEKAYAKLFAKENSGRGKAVKIRPASKAAKK